MDICTYSSILLLVDNPRVGLVKNMGRWDRGLLRGMKETHRDYYLLINVVTYLKMKNPQVG